MSAVTNNISRYIKEKGISLSKISRDTGVAYQPLYDSLLNEKRDRNLRDYELLAVCDFLGVDPRQFGEKRENVR